MPKIHTFPTLYNEVLQLNITKLKSWGYLDSTISKSGVINWSKNGKVNNSISIQTHIYKDKPYIQIDYKFRDEPRNYRIYLTSKPSNLQKGIVWYFICPRTRKICRKLYCINGYFLHRKAFNGCMYESQTFSKKDRVLIKIFDIKNGEEKIIEELFKKNLKKHYKGKPTKKYLKIQHKIKIAEKFQDVSMTELLIK